MSDIYTSILEDFKSKLDQALKEAHLKSLELAYDLAIEENFENLNNKDNSSQSSFEDTKGVFVKKVVMANGNVEYLFSTQQNGFYLTDDFWNLEEGTSEQLYEM